MPIALTNLIVNPSIETNITNWTANGGATLTRVSTQQQSGSWSLQVACTAVANSGTQCAAITAGVGETYSAGVYLRGNAGGETVDVQLRNQAGTVITTVAVTLTTAWQRFTLTGVTPGSTTSINLRVNKAAATAHTYFLDAAMVTSGPDVWPYFDGDTPGARWGGTAHASTSAIQISSASGDADYTYQVGWSGVKTTFTNLIFDPSVEGDGTGWVIGGGGTRAVVYDQVHSQGFSMRYTLTSGGAVFLCSVGNPGDVGIPGIVAGHTYSAAIWVRSTRAVFLGLRLRWMTGASSGDLSWSDFTLTDVYANTWTRLVLNGIVAPATATHCRLGVNEFPVSTQSGDVMWFDDAILTESRDALPYFDGVVDGEWTGAKFASTSTMAIANFEGTGDDVSARLLSDPVNISGGRDSARALSPTTSGQASFDLDNVSRDYSPDNASSPLAGLGFAGREVRIRASKGPMTYTPFRGFIDDFELDPRAKTVSFSCVDMLQRLNEQEVSTQLYQGLRTGDAVNYLLDAIGWPAGEREIDPGATLMPWWWAEGTAGEELTKLTNSEGPTALCTIDSDGRFIFRDRHHRLRRAKSLIAQSVIRVTGSGTWDPLASWPLDYDHGAKAVINDVAFSVAQRMPSGPQESVWTSEKTITVADGETIEVTARSSEPFIGAVVPVVDQDYTITGAGAATVTLTRDSGQTVGIRIYSTGGPVAIQGLTLRANPVPVVSTVQVNEYDPASINIYGRRAWPNDAPWAGVHDARAIARMILAQRAERLPTVTATLKNYNDLVLLHMLNRDLSDRVRIIDAETGLDDDFFIEQITHQIHGAGNRVHETTFACEKAPTQVANVFILGSATRGVLGTNRLGKSGLDDPSTVFVLGSTTNGVLGTNLLGR